MTLIKQRGPSDCGIASLAMFTGLPYEVCYQAGIDTGQFHPKKGTSHACYILRHLGFKQDALRGSAENDACTGRAFRNFWHSWELNPDYVRMLMWGRPTLFSVPSLNREGGHHMVYYDGTHVFDPQHGRRGKKWHDLEDFDKLSPGEIIVWRTSC